MNAPTHNKITSKDLAMCFKRLNYTPKKIGMWLWTRALLGIKVDFDEVIEECRNLCILPDPGEQNGKSKTQ